MPGPLPAPFSPESAPGPPEQAVITAPKARAAKTTKLEHHASCRVQTTVWIGRTHRVAIFATTSASTAPICSVPTLLG